MKGYERALDEMMRIRGMDEGNLYFPQGSRIPLVYVRPILYDEKNSEYRFRCGIRHVSQEVHAKYKSISDKVFVTAQEAADYIIAIAKKENGVE